MTLQRTRPLFEQRNAPGTLTERQRRHYLSTCPDCGATRLDDGGVLMAYECGTCDEWLRQHSES